MSTTPARVLCIPGDLLDYYLSLGYYRMNQDLFTCRFLPVADNLYTVHWLRVVVPQVQYGGKQRQLLRQNARFTVVVKPFRLTPEYEALYALYYQSVAFDTAASLEALLLAGAPHSVFNTHLVEVRDGDRLVAGGIFDRGADTIAGIVNFYDPAYHKFSLGKYLLLLKIEYARQHQLVYYYPGYLVQGYPKFDYKLFACPAATEVFDCLSSQWLPFAWEAVNEQSTRLLADWRTDWASEEL